MENKALSVEEMMKEMDRIEHLNRKVDEENLSVYSKECVKSNELLHSLLNKEIEGTGHKVMDVLMKDIKSKQDTELMSIGKKVLMGATSFGGMFLIYTLLKKFDIIDN